MKSLGIALAFLTRLPTWDPGVLPPEALGPPTRWFPLVGALVGGLIAAFFGLASLFLPPWPAALLAIVLAALVTGALHEDGLADLADALGCRGDAERRREVMKDPRLGTFGVLALVFSVSLRASALVALGPALAAGWLFASHTVSRAILVVPLWRSAGDGAGLGSAVARAVRPLDVCLALTLATLLILPWLGPWAPVPFVVAGLAFASPVRWARRNLGTVSGDVLGAGQQLAEIAILLTGVVLLTTGSHPEVPFWR